MDSDHKISVPSILSIEVQSRTSNGFGSTAAMRIRSIRAERCAVAISAAPVAGEVAGCDRLLAFRS